MLYAVGMLTIAACTSVTESSEIPLVGTTLYYGPSDRFLPLLEPEVEVFTGDSGSGIVSFTHIAITP